MLKDATELKMACASWTTLTKKYPEHVPNWQSSEQCHMMFNVIPSKMFYSNNKKFPEIWVIQESIEL